MVKHKSTVKRARQNIDRRTRNKALKTRMKNVIKAVRVAVGEKSNETALDRLNVAKSVISKTAKKGVIHKKAASRKISRLTRSVNSIAA